MCPNIHFYVVCVASFQKDINHGVWVDALMPIEDMQQEINNMLSSSIAKKGWNSII